MRFAFALTAVGTLAGLSPAQQPACQKPAVAAPAVVAPAAVTYGAVAQSQAIVNTTTVAIPAAVVTVPQIVVAQPQVIVQPATVVTTPAVVTTSHAVVSSAAFAHSQVVVQKNVIAQNQGGILRGGLLGNRGVVVQRQRSVTRIR